MDPETALFWNHIFGSDYWGFLLLIGIVLLILPRVIKLTARPRKICRRAGAGMMLLFFLACIMCMYTYIESSQGFIEDEFACRNNVSVMVVEPYTIRFTNNGEENAVISNRYKIERLIERSWYDIDPESSGLQAAPFEELELAPGESVDLTFDISCYGELAPRHYRYAVEGSSYSYYFAEFDITEDGEFIWPE